MEEKKEVCPVCGKEDCECEKCECEPCECTKEESPLKEDVKKLGEAAKDVAKDLGEAFKASKAGEFVLGEDGKLGKEDLERIGNKAVELGKGAVDKIKEVVSKKPE